MVHVIMRGTPVLEWGQGCTNAMLGMLLSIAQRGLASGSFRCASMMLACSTPRATLGFHEPSYACLLVSKAASRTKPDTRTAAALGCIGLHAYRLTSWVPSSQGWGRTCSLQSNMHGAAATKGSCNLTSNLPLPLGPVRDDVWQRTSCHQDLQVALRVQVGDVVQAQLDDVYTTGLRLLDLIKKGSHSWCCYAGADKRWTSLLCGLCGADICCSCSTLDRH